MTAQATPSISQIALAPLSINIPLTRDDITPVKPVQFTTGVTFAPAMPFNSQLQPHLRKHYQQRVREKSPINSDK